MKRFENWLKLKVLYYQLFNHCLLACVLSFRIIIFLTVSTILFITSILPSWPTHTHWTKQLSHSPFPLPQLSLHSLLNQSVNLRWVTMIDMNLGQKAEARENSSIYCFLFLLGQSFGVSPFLSWRADLFKHIRYL